MFSSCERSTPHERFRALRRARRQPCRVERWHEENFLYFDPAQHKKSKVPTAERLLNAFSHITLTRILDDAGNIVSKFLTPLSDVQKEILRHLGLDVDIYHRLTN